MKRKLIAVVAGAILLLAGCTDSAVGDRTSGKGQQADTFADATKVKIYRNADSVPNVALFCTDGKAWWSTLSGSDDGTNKGAIIIRDREMDDSYCGKP